MVLQESIIASNKLEEFAPLFYPKSRWRNASNHYLSEGIPVFLTLERAAKALANLVGHYKHCDTISTPDSNKQKSKELATDSILHRLFLPEKLLAQQYESRKAKER